MGASAADTPTPSEAVGAVGADGVGRADGANAAAGGLRASDAERDAAAARIREGYAAGRLSHETFLHRVNEALGARQRADLAPLVADLPPAAAPVGPRALLGRVRGAWQRLLGPATVPARQAPAAPVRAAPVRARTMGMLAARGAGRPLALRFPRADGAGDAFSIGRDAACDLAIADMTVSRRHAMLERIPDGWLLTDLASTNGTRVNGWRVRGKVRVIAGDLVSFGDAEVVLAGPDDLPALPG